MSSGVGWGGWYYLRHDPLRSDDDQLSSRSGYRNVDTSPVTEEVACVPDPVLMVGSPQAFGGGEDDCVHVATLKTIDGGDVTAARRSGGRGGFIDSSSSTTTTTTTTTATTTRSSVDPDEGRCWLTARGWIDRGWIDGQGVTDGPHLGAEGTDDT